MTLPENAMLAFARDGLEERRRAPVTPKRGFRLSMMKVGALVVGVFQILIMSAWCTERKVCCFDDLPANADPALVSGNAGNLRPLRACPVIG